MKDDPPCDGVPSPDSENRLVRLHGDDHHNCSRPHQQGEGGSRRRGRDCYNHTPSHGSGRRPWRPGWRYRHRGVATARRRSLPAVDDTDAKLASAGRLGSTVFDPEALFEPEREAQPQSRRQTRRELTEVGGATATPGAAAAARPHTVAAAASAAADRPWRPGVAIPSSTCRNRQTP